MNESRCGRKVGEGVILHEQLAAIVVGPRQDGKGKVVENAVRYQVKPVDAVEPTGLLERLDQRP